MTPAEVEAAQALCDAVHYATEDLRGWVMTAMVERDATIERLEMVGAEARASMSALCYHLEDVEAERDAARATIERVRALHTPYRIYDECDCTQERRDDDPDSNHVNALDIGTTCNLLYVICRECCCDGTDREYQTEGCTSYHEHWGAKPLCPTLAALDDPSTDEVGA